MARSVLTGTIHAVEPGLLTLTPAMQVIVPLELALTDFPLGSSVSVTLQDRDDGRLIAESIKLLGEGFLGAGREPA